MGASRFDTCPSGEQTLVERLSFTVVSPTPRDSSRKFSLIGQLQRLPDVTTENRDVPAEGTRCAFTSCANHRLNPIVAECGETCRRLEMPTKR